jgi:hypothetical protein
LVEQIAQVEVLAQASADAAVCEAAARVHIPTGGHILELGMQLGWRLGLDDTPDQQQGQLVLDRFSHDEDMTTTAVILELGCSTNASMRRGTATTSYCTQSHAIDAVVNEWREYASPLRSRCAAAAVTTHTAEDAA